MALFIAPLLCAFDFMSLAYSSRVVTFVCARARVPSHTIVNAVTHVTKRRICPPFRAVKSTRSGRMLTHDAPQRSGVDVAPTHHTHDLLARQHGARLVRRRQR